MCDDFSTFLMASLLVYNYLASAQQIYTFSREGELPSKKDEFKMKGCFLVVSTFGIIICFTFLFCSNFFYFTSNWKALSTTYHFSMISAAIFSLYLSGAYCRCLFLLR